MPVSLFFSNPKALSLSHYCIDRQETRSGKRINATIAERVTRSYVVLSKRSLLWHSITMFSYTRWQQWLSDYLNHLLYIVFKSMPWCFIRFFWLDFHATVPLLRIFMSYYRGCSVHFCLSFVCISMFYYQGIGNKRKSWVSRSHKILIEWKSFWVFKAEKLILLLGCKFIFFLD